MGRANVGAWSQKYSSSRERAVSESNKFIGGFKSLSGMLREQLSGSRNIGDRMWKMNMLSDEAVTDCRNKVGNAQLNNWLL